MVHVILMANWGMGTEILITLHRYDQVDIKGVITRREPGAADSWINSVWECSNKLGYPTFSQENLAFSDIERMVRRSGVDLLICHAFMRIIPESVFTAPRLGTINVHPSLLPKYRGPSPTYWVLKNKETRTGLTCHFVNDQPDNGDIISQAEIAVKPGDTIQSVIERQKIIAGGLIVEAVQRVQEPSFRPRSQDSAIATWAPRPY